MEKVIWKYPLELVDTQVLTLPHGSKFLSLLEQNNKPVLYFLVDLNTPKDKSPMHFKILIVKTGQPILSEVLDTAKFLGSVPIFNGRLIWHVYEVT